MAVRTCENLQSSKTMKKTWLHNDCLDLNGNRDLACFFLLSRRSHFICNYSGIAPFQSRVSIAIYSIGYHIPILWFGHIDIPPYSPIHACLFFGPCIHWYIHYWLPSRSVMIRTYRYLSIQGGMPKILRAAFNLCIARLRGLAFPSNYFAFALCAPWHWGEIFNFVAQCAAGPAAICVGHCASCASCTPNPFRNGFTLCWYMVKLISGLW